MVEVRLREHERQRCPLCKDGLPPAEAHACAACETPYHTGCLAELGGCSTLGCSLQGKLPDTISHWSCRACHRPIDRELTRRNCRCGAYLHDGCVEAHGEACARAGELRRVTGRPAPPRREPLDPQTGAALRFVLTVSAVWLVVIGWASYVTLTASPNLPPRDPRPGVPAGALAEAPAGGPRVASNAGPRVGESTAPSPQTVPAPAHGVPGSVSAEPAETAETAAPDEPAVPSVAELVAGLHHPAHAGDAGDALRARWPADLLALLELANVDDPSHTAALRALAVASGRDAELVVVDACRHPDVHVRRAALRALLCLADGPAVRAAAERALESPDEVVRRRAEQALVHFDPAPPIPGFDD